MNYLETLKNVTKDKSKRVENLVFLLILLVVLLLAINYIFTPSSEKSSQNENSTSNGSNINDNKDNSKVSEESYQSDLESKLSNILSQISGISDVSVVLTYSKDSTTTPVYNTKEQEKSGERITEKSVAYNEEGNNKTALIETIEMPKIEGAIIVAKGASTVDIRSKIATAISSLTNVPVYKVQVFEKKD